MKKLLALTLAAVMTLALLAGCGGKDGGSTPDTNAPDTNAPAADGNTTAPDDSKPAASGSVYWLNFKPESDEVLQNVAKLYTEKTGVEVKVVTAAAGTYNQQLNAEMDKSNPPHPVCHRQPGRREGLGRLRRGPHRHRYCQRAEHRRLQPL